MHLAHKVSFVKYFFIYTVMADMFVRMLPMAGRTAGLIKTKLGIGTHVEPGSVLVKVKVIYLCMRYNRIHNRKFMTARPGE